MDGISKSLNNKEQSAALFLDVAKAFDKVWHKGLLFKIYKSNFPIEIIKIIESFLENRSFSVKMDGVISSSMSIKAGLPQGSCLSPSFFNLFTNDIPVNVNSQVSLFADDTMFISKNKNANYAAYQLQKQINNASVWFMKWRLQINESKSVAILFSQKNHKNIRPITINGQIIPWANSVNYLGITLNRNLDTNIRTKNILRKGHKGPWYALPPI